MYAEVRGALDIKDDGVIVASHETYEQRKQLFEHINEVLAQRQHKGGYARAGERKLNNLEIDQIYTWYAEQMNEMNKTLLNTSSGENNNNQQQ